VLFAVLGLTLFSAACQILITWWASLYAPADQWPRFKDLVETFKQAWGWGVAGLIGMAGGKHMK
jgi:hypothetical protein